MLDVCFFLLSTTLFVDYLNLFLPERTSRRHITWNLDSFFVFSYPMNISLPNTKSQRFIKISEGLLRSKHCRCLFVGKRGKIKGLSIATLWITLSWFPLQKHFLFFVLFYNLNFCTNITESKEKETVVRTIIAFANIGLLMRWI